MNSQPAVRAPDKVGMIFLHLEIIDGTLALLSLDLRERNRVSCAGDDGVPERESACDHEADARTMKGCSRLQTTVSTILPVFGSAKESDTTAGADLTVRDSERDDKKIRAYR